MSFWTLLRKSLRRQKRESPKRMMGTDLIKGQRRDQIKERARDLSATITTDLRLRKKKRRTKKMMRSPQARRSSSFRESLSGPPRNSRQEITRSL